ncbi:unnamed protein product [Heterobilharzia americana]|nr:unnamed protein product [Heterobilharzia americana]
MNLINVTSMNEKISELSIDEFMNKSGKEEETISSPHNSKDIEVSVQNSAYCLNDISKGVIADLSDSKHESLDSYDYDLQKSSSFDELKGQNHVDCTHSDNVNNNTSIKTVIKQKSKKNKKISQHNKHTPSHHHHHHQRVILKLIQVEFNKAVSLLLYFVLIFKFSFNSKKKELKLLAVIFLSMYTSKPQKL